MKSVGIVATLVGLALLATACAHVDPASAERAERESEAAVMKRATFDLQCDKQDIEVVQLGRRSYGASGCGRRASYMVECYGDSNCDAVLNSETKPEREDGDTVRF